ncbi:hypothetical protein HDU79_011407 [Rhizoclosmatium sp. JEL0117]|nr:hypothetical protein HDU79_011407 [Rhizoclosmatium sp. JEL0117]
MNSTSFHETWFPKSKLIEDNGESVEVDEAYEQNLLEKERGKYGSIDFAQIQLLDYMNGENRVMKHRPFGGSLQKNVTFDPLESWKPVYEHMQHPEVVRKPSFLHIGSLVRSTLIAYRIRYEDPPFRQTLLESLAKNSSEFINNVTTELDKTLETRINHLTQMLFPWLHTKTLHDLQLLYHNKSTDGIVMTVGNIHFKYAYHGILALRQVLHCTLPIEVFYANKNDLTPENVAALAKLPNVKVKNLGAYFPTEMSDIQKWSVKPFGLLASSFRRTIFIDADTLFFKDPSSVILKESDIFQRYGLLFFHDRSLNRGNGPFPFFEEANPFLSNYAKGLRFSRGLSWHEQESGLVAMDKSRIGVLIGLLFSCLMNSKAVRSETYGYVWGDKETFWLSMELARVPYKFVPGYSGAVGYKTWIDGTIAVCGSNYHVDEGGKPFWWNGGVLQRRRQSDSVFMRFEYAAVDTEKHQRKWEMETNLAPFCLKPAFPQREIVQLSRQESSIGNQYVKMYKSLGIPAPVIDNEY